MEPGDFEMDGITAMQLAREMSRMPEGTFTLAFFPYSRKTGRSSARLKVKEGCRWRTQLPRERFDVDSDNLLLFTDGEGRPRMCWRILVRYMGFPQDGFKLHKINWL